METNFSCYIIGEGSLPVICAKKIIENGNTIKGIITNNSQLSQWGESNGIPVIGLDADIQSLLTNEEFDYLLSIVNNEVLSGEIIRSPKVTSINYHDALLPKYAGINATSWAIMNNEKKHGISWHVMNENIDEGDILLQKEVQISNGETAVTLNSKCFDAAIESFDELLIKLTHQEIIGKKQDINSKSFFRRHQQPAGDLVLDFNQDADYVCAVVRGLDFGTYENTIGLMKIFLDGDVYLIRNCESVESSTNNSIPGTIQYAKDSSIILAMKNKSIEIKKLTFITGKEINIDDVINNHNLKEGKNIALESNNSIATVLRDNMKFESYWKKSFLSSNFIELPFSAGAFKELKNTNQNIVELNFLGKNNINKTLEETNLDYVSFITALLYAYIKKLTNQNTVTINYTDTELQAKSKKTNKILSACIPLTIDISEQFSFIDLAEEIKRTSSTVASKGQYLEDIFIRYPELYTHKNEYYSPLQIVAVNDASELETTIDIISIVIENESSCFLKCSDVIIASIIKDQLQNILNSIIIDQNINIKEYSLLSEQDHDKILNTWNATDIEYAEQKEGKCVHEIIEDQALKTPNNIAVEFEDETLTYEELNQKSNQLAALLIEKGVKPETIVGVEMHRSIEMVVSLLAVIKAGGAYLPIDPEYPEQRHDFVINDARPLVILSQGRFEERFNNTDVEVVFVDKQWAEIEKYDTVNNDVNVVYHNIAYVIYTSGSTGVPKGVLSIHEGFVNRLLWQQEQTQLNETDIILQKTPYTFDVSVWEFFLPLMTGSRLVMAIPEGHKDSSYLQEVINTKKVTTLHFVPSMLKVFYADNGLEECKGIKHIICSGEALPFDIKEHIVNNYTLDLYNLYGPTEASIDVSYWKCEKNTNHNIVPIGKPIANTQLYILDEALKPVPVGVPGVLYIGGIGLAKEYLNRPVLTTERFINNPFSNGTYKRLYNTGDLACYMEDGNIEFLGRIDNQVKIRGFRIELGEVEASIDKIETIRDCVVVAKEDTAGNKRLVAYILSDDEFNVQEIRESLSKSLPDYMVPSLFVSLEKMPLTPNGKIDRKALPEPEGHIETTNKYAAPRTETEQKLADIWTKVLGVEKVGIYDNFFELGGDSIISIQIASRAKQVNISLTPKDIFEHKTIAELAKASKTYELKIIAEQGLVSGEIPLTPIQSWFFEEDFENKDHWNQAVMLKVKDTVEISIIENAINALVQQHDVLRLAYHIEKGKWIQKHNEPLKYGLEVVDCSNLSGEELSISIEERSSKTQGSLSITGGALFKAVLFKKGNYNELLIAINHLVVDGVSWRILIEDLEKACLQQISNEEIDLGLKTSSFKQWSEKLTEYAKSDQLPKELKFWNETISKSNDPLPIDFSGEDTGMSVKNISVKLNKKLTKQLLKEAGKAYKTEINDLLLTSLAISLEKWTGNNNIIINLEGHGREDIFIDTDISRTVGWFTSQFPVCLSLEKDNNIADTIKSTKEQLRAIPNKGIGYGILRYLHPDISVRERLSLKTNNEISFNYLGQFDNLQENGDLISFSKQSPGVPVSNANHRTNIIDINSMISGGELVINFTYSGNLHKKETIENLANSYVAGLQNIIEHCLLPESKGDTPSDFPLANINQEELDNILSINNTEDLINGEGILL